MKPWSHSTGSSIEFVVCRARGRPESSMYAALYPWLALALSAAAPCSGGSIIWDARNVDTAELAKWDWARQQGK